MSIIVKPSRGEIEKFGGVTAPSISPEAIQRRGVLFQRLKRLSPIDVLALKQEYDENFGIGSSGNLTAEQGVLGLSTVENLTFEIDRLIILAQAVQNAVREIAKIKTGPINVVDAGMGLGYPLLAALALNPALGNKIKVIGLEFNRFTKERAEEVFDFFGIPKEWFEIVEADARTFKGIPDDTHILVAEHYETGLFSKEPAVDILKNCVPQLKEPYRLIPSGLDIWGRVVGDEYNPDIQNQAVVDAILKARKGARSQSYRLLTGMVEMIDSDALGAENPYLIMGPRKLARLDIAKILAEGWDGHVNFQMDGKAMKEGAGVPNLRMVLRFPHERGNVYLQRERYYVDNTFEPGKGRSGTGLNSWLHIRKEDAEMAFQYALRQPNDIAQAIATSVRRSLRFAHRFNFERGKKYQIEIDGNIGNIWADVKKK